LAECLGLTRDASDLTEVLEEERRTARQLGAIAAEIFGAPAGNLS